MQIYIHLFISCIYYLLNIYECNYSWIYNYNGFIKYGNRKRRPAKLAFKAIADLPNVVCVID